MKRTHVAQYRQTSTSIAHPFNPMAKAKSLPPAINKLEPALHKKASRSRVGKIPDARADVPFDDDIEGNYQTAGLPKAFHDIGLTDFVTRKQAFSSNC
jgi:hypothetical protein